MGEGVPPELVATVWAQDLTRVFGACTGPGGTITLSVTCLINAIFVSASSIAVSAFGNPARLSVSTFCIDGCFLVFSK